ncbi:MAG: hypothetical protein K8S55_10350 [Phycisphaerae bacterium]|nr:hypothetical protein [Phycisphaerae bacterium]
MESIDWFKVIIHFVCGAVVGALAGVLLWLYLLDGESMQIGLMLIGGGAVVFGLLAGIFLERFWEGIKEHSDLFWPW